MQKQIGGQPSGLLIEALTQQPNTNGLTMESIKKNYLFLISASADSAASVQKIHRNLIQSVDAGCKPRWIDSRGAGFFISSKLTAAEIWSVAFIDSKFSGDALAVELGRDWMARKDATTEHWLKTHLGSPLS